MPSHLYLRRLTWDAWNLEHIAKHEVSSGEADEVAAAEPVVRTTYKGRFQLIGPTSAGRMLTVIAGPDPTESGVYYVFSARPASRKERAYYHHEKGASLA